MKRIAILGASGHGKVIADTASLLGYYEIVFFDDAWPGKTNNGEWSVNGTTEDLINNLSEFDSLIVGIGNNSNRIEKHKLIRDSKGSLINLIHPKATISSRTRIGIGSVFFAGSVINVDVVIGDAVIINTGATVDHDCVIDDGVHIAPGAHLSGHVKVGKRSWIGVGASIKQGVFIGSDVIVGAGAVVIRDVPDGVTVVGNPARNLSK